LLKRERDRLLSSLQLIMHHCLKRYLADEWLHKMYVVACADAFKETGLQFPEVCPYGINDVLAQDIHF
jgi:hypothetical protein